MFSVLLLWLLPAYIAAMTDETRYLQNIDQAIVDAGVAMDLGDIDTSDDDESELVWESRHHCGVCQTRTVMEIVWPSIEAYIQFLKRQVTGE